jgi:ankyrin repeat protein
MAPLLLKNGANPNRGGSIDLLPNAKLGPLFFAISNDNVRLVRSLLRYHADPNYGNRRPAPEEEERINKENAEHEAIQPPPWRSHCYWDQLKSPRNTDVAIYHGNAKILRLLLDHGAYVGLSYHTFQHHATAIVHLLKYNNADSFTSTATSNFHPLYRGSPIVQMTTSVCLKTKVAICKMLLDHANSTAQQENSDDGVHDDDCKEINSDGTAQFLQASLERLLIEDVNDKRMRRMRRMTMTTLTTMTTMTTITTMPRLRQRRVVAKFSSRLE